MASPPWGRRGTGDRAQVRKLLQQSETAAVQKDAEKERALARLRQQLAWRPPPNQHVQEFRISKDFSPRKINTSIIWPCECFFFSILSLTQRWYFPKQLMLPDVGVVLDKIPVSKDPPSPSPYLIFR